MTVPTWQGWTVIALTAAALALAVLLQAMPFLAVNAPVGTGVLVVEGWLPEEVAAQVADRFSQGDYALVITTAEDAKSPPYRGHFASASDLAVETLTAAGLPDAVVRAVPAPLVARDRTFASAMAVRAWLDSSEFAVPQSIDVMSMGPHARRSRLMYQMAFGEQTVVGIIAVDEKEYDARRWWRSSAGVKSILGETVAYLYAKILFWP